MTAPIPKRIVLSEAILNILSKPISKVLIRTSLTPNQVTAIGGIFALIGILFYSSNRITSSIFLLLYLLLDLVDGDIAREKRIFTKLGWWGDKIIDKSVECLLLFSAYIAYQGNLKLEVSIFITLCFVYITQFSMEAINQIIKEEKRSPKYIQSIEMATSEKSLSRKSKDIILLIINNLTLGHSLLIILISFGTLILSESIIFPLMALLSFATFLYLMISHYKICLKF